MADLTYENGARDGARTRDLRRDRPGTSNEINGCLTLERPKSGVETHQSVRIIPLPLPDCARHLARLYLAVPQEKRGFVSTLRQQLLAWDNGGNQDQLRKSILKRIDAIERVEAFNADKR